VLKSCCCITYVVAFACTLARQMFDVMKIGVISIFESALAFSTDRLVELNNIRGQMLV